MDFSYSLIAFLFHQDVQRAQDCMETAIKADRSCVQAYETLASLELQRFVATTPCSVLVSRLWAILVCFSGNTDSRICILSLLTCTCTLTQTPISHKHIHTYKHHIHSTYHTCSHISVHSTYMQHYIHMAHTLTHHTHHIHTEYGI